MAMKLILEKFSFLILSLSMFTGIPVVPGIQLISAIDDSEVHNREVRSLTDGLGWHLDRINQRSLPLDGQYTPLENGSSVATSAINYSLSLIASYSSY